MTADPLAQVNEAVEIDCGAATCDMHDLGPLPGELRPDWLARLKARFEAFPLPERKADARWVAVNAMPVAASTKPASLLVDCERCGEPRWCGKACQACRMSTRIMRWRAAI